MPVNKLSLTHIESGMAFNPCFKRPLTKLSEVDADLVELLAN